MVCPACRLLILSFSLAPCLSFWFLVVSVFSGFSWFVPFSFVPFHWCYLYFLVYFSVFPLLTSVLLLPDCLHLCLVCSWVYLSLVFPFLRYWFVCLSSDNPGSWLFLVFLLCCPSSLWITQLSFGFCFLNILLESPVSNAHLSPTLKPWKGPNHNNDNIQNTIESSHPWCLGPKNNLGQHDERKMYYSGCLLHSR